MLALPAVAAEDLTILALPRPLGPGESAVLEVPVGVVARGQEVLVTTADGRLVGAVSPFAIRPGAAAGTYTVPVPADAIRDGRLALRLRITRADGPPRPPTGQEVGAPTLRIAGPHPGLSVPPAPGR